MSALYIIGGLTAFACFSVWLAVRLAGQGGAEQERAKQAVEANHAAKKAGAVIAEHRGDGDTVDRLQSGRF